jgi:hypothetical protein
MDYKSDMMFLLWQLNLMEHAQDRVAIKEVAARHGIALPIFEDPRVKSPKLKAKERRAS